MTSAVWQPTLDFVDVANLGSQTSNIPGSVKIHSSKDANLTKFAMYALNCKGVNCMIGVTMQFNDGDTNEKMYMVEFTLSNNFMTVTINNHRAFGPPNGANMAAASYQEGVIIRNLAG